MSDDGKDFDGNGSIICTLRDLESQASDARLIAASPLLLTMLRRMVDEAAGGQVCLLTMEQARNAIDAATVKP